MKKPKDYNEKNVALKNDTNGKTIKRTKKVSLSKEEQKEKVTKTKKITKKSEVEKEGSKAKINETKKIVKTPTKKTKSTSSVIDKKTNAEMEEETFEDKVFSVERKKNTFVVNEKINFMPIIVIAVLAIISAIIYLGFVKGFFSITEKKMPESNIMAEHTIETNMTPKEANNLIEDVVNDKSVDEKEEVADLSIDDLNKVFPLYDKDIYSEGALKSFDDYSVTRAGEVIDELMVDNTYETTATAGQKEILQMNKLLIDNYLDKFDQTQKDEYDAAPKRPYYADITTQSDKVGNFYHTDYIALTLFSAAKDKGFYYEVPTSLYKKIIINKKAFDEMEINQEGSINLPVNNDGSLEKTIVKKVGSTSLTYVDKMQKTRVVNLQQKSDTEYCLIDTSNGSYMTQLFMNDDSICILKDARVGHGKTMEYIANNYLKYPNELSFEVYVNAEEIVNQTSSNSMLNGQHINSNKQIWDDKGFIVSLVFFEN